jgi:RNA polymerase sigma-70 factor (ECF subfamily)
MTARPPALRAPQPDPDAYLLARLRSGDEQAFMILVDRYQQSMLRLAAGYVPSRAVAEEVVQDAWVGFLRGLGQFEARSSVRTWLFRILVNRARSAAVRERRSIAVEDLEASVAAARFDRAGSWAVPPELWTDLVDDRLVALRMAGVIRSALADMPIRQREVVMLRDVDGLSSAEVCGVLGISDANQRVLLHRGRGWLRRLLESEPSQLPALQGASRADPGDVVAHRPHRRRGPASRDARGPDGALPGLARRRGRARRGPVTAWAGPRVQARAGPSRLSDEVG